MAGTSGITNLLRLLTHNLFVILGAVALTTLFFLVLPLIQAISKPPTEGLELVQVDTTNLPPPPPPPDDPQEQEEEQEEQPPELAEPEAPPLDLSQLEVALNTSMGDGWMAGDFAVKLNTLASSKSKNVDTLFSIADLDQQPRVVYTADPVMNARMRKKAPATVTIIFIVNEKGRVENPKILSCPDPIFERPSLNAIKKWKFEPGKRSGQPVPFRMKCPITFPGK